MASSLQTIAFCNAFTRTTTNAQLSLNQVYVGGSDTANAIVLLGKDMAKQHFELVLVADHELRITPISHAPIAINSQMIHAASPLADGDWLALGGSVFQIKFVQHAVPAIAEDDSLEKTMAVTQLASSIALSVSQSVPQTRTLTIGRQDECDLVIGSPLVSREHARLYFSQTGIDIEDLSSTNGTFVNGQRLLGRAALKTGDYVAFAAYAFRFDGQQLEPINDTGRVRVEVQNLSKQIPDKNGFRYLLDDISLVIEQGEFVVIFGTSGSGKSTLLDALNGRRPATSGKVLYNDADLYQSFDELRATIGYVPQQDIVHRKITIQHALEYTAKLRLPKDTPEEERQTYIKTVLSRVELAEKADLAIDTPAPLSGGQLKRVSLAVELVANPNILFLDEVTSGLDAGTDKRMMRLFADLAADHKTVICVTHSLENIDVCHQVVLLHKGKLVYFGPPKEAAAYFGVAKLSDVYELLEASAANVWADKFRGSSYYQTYVKNRLEQHVTRTSRTKPNAQAHKSKPQKAWQFDSQQTLTLMMRYLDLIWADKKNLLILLLQAPLIAIVIGLVFEIKGTEIERATSESQIFFILVLSAIWFGTLNSARELVKELPVYLRERSVNLGIAPYLISKIIPLAVLCLLQCAMLTGIVMQMVDLPHNYLDRVLVLFVSGMAATSMGLAVSAFVDSNDKAVAMAPILLIPQVILSNAVVKLGNAGLLTAKCTMISFWGLDALKTTLSKTSLAAKMPMTNDLVIPITGSYAQNLWILLALGLSFLIIAVLGLKLKDRK